MLRFGPEVCDTILMSFIVTQNVAHVLYANDYPPYAAECIVRVIFVTSDLAACCCCFFIIYGSVAANGSINFNGQKSERPAAACGISDELFSLSLLARSFDVNGS